MEEKVCASCNRRFTSEKDFLTGTSRWRICDHGHLWFNCSCQSTLVLKKGKFSWYKPELTMSQEAANIFNHLHGKDKIPNIPSSVMQLQNLLNDPEAGTPEITRALKMNPLIAVEVINISNNMRVPGTAEIKDLAHAVNYIGRRAVFELVLVASIKTFKFKTQKYSTEIFWYESFINAGIAESMVKKFCPDINPEEAYFAASLCNIGKIVAAICLPEELETVYVNISNPKTQSTWSKAEDEHASFDHCILGEIAGTLWGLPEYVLDIARYHHDIPRPEGRPSIVDVIRLSNQLTHWITLNPSRIDKLVLDKMRAKFELSESELEEFAESLQGVKENVEQNLSAA